MYILLRHCLSLAMAILLSLDILGPLMERSLCDACVLYVFDNKNQFGNGIQISIMPNTQMATLYLVNSETHKTRD